jgi:hypothetical protein
MENNNRSRVGQAYRSPTKNDEKNQKMVGLRCAWPTLLL